MELTGKNVLVTGGAGAIGRTLVRELIRHGTHVIIVDDLSSGHRANLPEKGAEFVQASILDDSVMRSIFSKNKIDAIAHLAANFANQNSVDNPEKDLNVNGMGMLKMLQYAREHKVERFLFTSSSCVYGNMGGKVSEERQDYKLDTPYAITKLLGERYASFFHEMYGLNTTIVRYFNSYGPGEFPGMYRNVIPNFFHMAMKGKPLPIMGTGEETRDFNYVGNAVEGTMLAFTKDRGIGQVFNIGYGEEVRIIDLAKKINKITGNPAGIAFQERRAWDNVQKRCASIDKARKLLGYNPKVGLDEGLRSKYAWMQDMAYAGLLPK